MNMYIKTNEFMHSYILMYRKYAQICSFNFQSQINFDVYKNITILILSIIFDASEFFSLQYLQSTQNTHKKILEII